MKARGQAALLSKSKPTRRWNDVMSLPVPMGGLNTVASLNAMPETDCVQLINWIARGYGLKLRRGYLNWASGMGAPVKTILSYVAPAQGMTRDATRSVITPWIGEAGDYPIPPTTMRGKLFAATDDAIWDVSDRGVTPTRAYTLTNSQHAGRIYSTMFSNAAGSFLVCCSETDGYLYYNGTAWVKPVVGDGTGGTVGPVDPSKLCFVATWKHRLFFVERNSTNMWIGDVNALTGTLTLFDVGALFEHGGALAAIATWTMDAGQGIDDYLIVMSTEGDCALYQGTDPTTVGAFQLQGVWDIGRVPVGRRFFDQFGGDVLILSSNGLAPISHITRGGSSTLSATRQDYTAKIVPQVAAELRASLHEYGWETRFLPANGLIVINKPVTVNGVIQQYALALATYSWSNLTNMPATTFKNAEDYAFFGTQDGSLKLAFSAASDNESGGAQSAWDTAIWDQDLWGVGLNAQPADPIPGLVQPAFSYFHAPGTQKIFHMVRPTFLAEAPPSVTVRMNTDFSFQGAPGHPAYQKHAQAIWDTAIWDQDIWGGGLNTYQGWIACPTAVGYAGSVVISTLSVGDVYLSALDYMVSAGGPL